MSILAVIKRVKYSKLEEKHKGDHNEIILFRYA